MRDEDRTLVEDSAIATIARMTDTGTVPPVTEGFEVAISPDGRRAAYSPIGNSIREVMWLAQGCLRPKEAQ